MFCVCTLNLNERKSLVKWLDTTAREYANSEAEERILFKVCVQQSQLAPAIQTIFGLCTVFLILLLPAWAANRINALTAVDKEVKVKAGVVFAESSKFLSGSDNLFSAKGSRSDFKNVLLEHVSPARIFLLWLYLCGWIYITTQRRVMSSPVSLKDAFAI